MKKSSLLASTLALTLAIGCFTPASNADAANKLSLSTKTVTLKVNKSKTVSANKKVTWKSSNKKIAKVKKVSSKKAKITALLAGSCKITATSGKTKAVIRVTVKKLNAKTTVTVTPKPSATAKPQASASSQPLKTLTSEEKEKSENAIPEQMPVVTTAPPKNPAVYTASASGITLSITDYYKTGMKFAITNSNDTNITFGEDYKLQKLVNDSWESIPYINDTNWAFKAIAIMLSPNASSDKSINWEYMYGELTNGTYCIVKDFFVNGSRCEVACEFVIDDTTPTNATTTTTPVPKIPTATPVAVPAS